MGFGGWRSPWPLQWGGGDTPIDQALEALRAGVGKGHAPEQDGIEWRWREARAIGIAIGMTMAERAVSQFNPRFATSGITLYREMYELGGANDQEVRDAAGDAEADIDDFGEQQLLAKLQEIDPRFTFQNRTWEQSGTTMAGRTVGDWEGKAPFNFEDGGNDTAFPAYSDIYEFVIVLSGTTPDVAPTLADQEAIAKASAFLDDELPSWTGYTIGTTSGFVLDESLLDWGRFDDT